MDIIEHQLSTSNSKKLWNTIKAVVFFFFINYAQRNQKDLIFIEK